MNKRLASVAIALGLAGGGAAGVLLGTPGVSVAQTASSTTVASAPAGTPSVRADRSTIVSDTLKKLVDNGTINQTQSDAVAAALKAAVPADGGGRGHGGPGGGEQGRRGPNLDIVSKALGMTTTDLQTALTGGQTIAQVATSKGVDVQKVIDAVVSDYTAKEQAEVVAGTQPQAEVDQKIVDAKARITDMVNGKTPVRPAKAVTATPETTTTN